MARGVAAKSVNPRYIITEELIKLTSIALVVGLCGGAWASLTRDWLLALRLVVLRLVAVDELGGCRGGIGCEVGDGLHVCCS